jgi:hypothetical protein
LSLPLLLNAFVVVKSSRRLRLLPLLFVLLLLPLLPLPL